MSTKKIIISCICGRSIDIFVVGNNNADGKVRCACGRNITMHFRRHNEKQKDRRFFK